MENDEKKNLQILSATCTNNHLLIYVVASGSFVFNCFSFDILSILPLFSIFVIIKIIFRFLKSCMRLINDLTCLLNNYLQVWFLFSKSWSESRQNFIFYWNALHKINTSLLITNSLTLKWFFVIDCIWKKWNSINNLLQLVQEQTDMQNEQQDPFEWE